MKPGTNKSEREILKRMGATAHRNSGRGVIKGDGNYEGFTVDVKEAKESFTLNKSVWAKICTDAVKNRDDPMLLVVLDRGTRLAIIEWEVLEQLIGERNG